MLRSRNKRLMIHLLLSFVQEIMDVENLWKFSEAEINKLNQNQVNSRNDGAGTSSATLATNPLLAGLANSEDTSPDLIANLCNVADHRLYKIVKWCKSLPLFKNISVSLSLFHTRKKKIHTFNGSNISCLNCRSMIKSVCWSTHGVNCCCSRAASGRFHLPAKFAFHKANR